MYHQLCVPALAKGLDRLGVVFSLHSEVLV